jgi:1,2-dihydroxy-3-keto-5-methylthiopentene dioxygenase
MTSLTVYDDASPFAARETVTDRAGITDGLAAVGVGLEFWPAKAELGDAPTDERILAAYADEIERLKARAGYRSCDIVRLTPDHPERAQMRAKFLSEHVHDDDEVRFFVEGSGMFYIRADSAVHALECTAGDLIVLPAGVRHWFDTGEHPRFTAIRLFTTPEGWVARFTGDAIAEAIPLYRTAA